MQTELQASNTAPNLKTPKYLKILTGILLVMFPVGLFLMSTNYGKEYLWTTTIFLGLQAVIMILVLARFADLFSVFFSAVIIFIVSFFIEWWGVSSGFPFGNYEYTSVLQPQLFGVPLAIAFAWFSVTSAALVIARYIALGASGFTIAFLSSVFILATDILLEPFASFINNYWQWAEFKIPIQNFGAWFVLGFIFSLGLNKILNWNDNANQYPVIIPSIIIGINVLNFSILNLTNGYYVLTMTGLIIFAVVILASMFFKPNVASQ